MERKVIFRDRQEFQAADANNTQEFVDDSLQSVIKDTITLEREISGLTVSMKSATEIDIAAGRLWLGDQGKIYTQDETRTISVFSYLPVTNKKWLAVSVFGQESDTDIQPRDFLVDLQTGQTEPAAVPMERKREIFSQITAGLESSDPQKPEPPTGYTLIGYVLLNPNGIEAIEIAENKLIARLFDVNQRVMEVEDWKEQAEPKIQTLSSEIAAISARLGDTGIENRVRELAAEIVRLKELNNLPDTYSSFGSDHFLTNDESDVEDTEYHARAEEGIRFPWAGQTLQQMDLFNPFEAAVKKFTGFILPDFDEVIRLKVENYIASLSLSQYQFQTFEFRKMTLSRRRIRYGPTRIISSGNIFWRTGQFNPISGIFYKEGEEFTVLDDLGLHKFIRLPKLWLDFISKNYWSTISTVESINGSQIAQTFLNGQSGWLTKVNLAFTQKDTNGVVYLHICETDKGLPDLTKIIGSTSVAPANITAGTVIPIPRTSFIFPKPVFLEAGTRYAIVITSSGNHKIGLADGSQFTQGTLFYSLDGAYFQGDFTKDLMFTLFYANFKNTFVQVNLNPISLSDGIADLDILAPINVPEASDLIFEYQLAGVWIPLTAETADQLLGLPALLPVRCTFIGTRDVMPGLEFEGSQIMASRPAVTFEHISTLRTLAGDTEHVEVQALLENWDDTKHTCTIKIKSGVTTYDHTGAYEDTNEGVDTIRRKAIFTLTGTPIDEYSIIIEGTTTTALDVFHVAERIDIAF